MSTISGYRRHAGAPDGDNGQNRIGVVLVFDPRVDLAKANEELRKLSSHLIYQLSIQEFNDRYGFPVFYIP
jgi:hypothetical protein